MRPSAALAVIFAFGTSCIAQDVARSWYPLQPGNSWVYRIESLDGYMAHPDVERWTTEETVISAAPAPELAGTLVTMRIKTLAGRIDAPRDSYLLIRQNCVYALDRPDDVTRHWANSHDVSSRRVCVERDGTQCGPLRGDGRQDVPYVGAGRIGHRDRPMV